MPCAGSLVEDGCSNAKLRDEEKDRINRMKVLVIVAHPHRASFNHVIAQTCSRALTDNGHEVIAHDLYEEHFNPLLPYGEFPKDAVLPADESSTVTRFHRRTALSSFTRTGGGSLRQY